MFELTNDEFENWRTQFESSNTHSLRTQFASLKNTSQRGKHAKYLPYAFTEQGIAMLSSVLNAPRAIEVNIAIMRTFVKMRKLMLQNVELSERMRELEASVIDRFNEQDEKFDILFDAIRSLTEQPQVPRRPIGFNESNVKYGKSPKGDDKVI
jgi:phage regulator Rha-like protein